MNKKFREGALVRAFLMGCILFAVGFFSQGFSNHKLKRGFYYWESGEYHLSENELKELNNLKVQKFYVKFFEVGLNNEMRAVPISKTNLELQKKELKQAVEIVPAIFIDNNVFKQISKEDAEVLADNIIHLVGKRFGEQFKDFGSYNELQIDCDWTISTKDAYHAFLKNLRSKLDKTLSATLRLYPYKFPDKMGILPVDRAMLMCYNLISPLEFKRANSVLEVGELEKYLVGSKKYPVALDVALPLFTNVLVYKSNQLVGMAHLSEEEVTSITKKRSELWRVVVKDSLIDNIAFEVGDDIKFEKVSPKNLNKAIKTINENVLLADDATLSFFQLNDKQINDYGLQSITTYYTSVTGK